MVNHVFAFSRRSDRIVQMVSFLAKLSQPVHSGIQVHDFDTVYGLLVLNVSHEQTNKQAHLLEKVVQQLESDTQIRCGQFSFL